MILLIFIGAGDANLVEPLTVSEEYSAVWSKGLSALNFEELARLKFQEGFTIKQLAKRFKVGVTTIKEASRISAQAPDEAQP